MNAAAERAGRGDAWHLFNFIQLVFGIVLTRGFQALFDAAKLILGDRHSVDDLSRFFHEYWNSADRALLGPALDSVALSVALILSLVQYYVIIHQLVSEFDVGYSMWEFVGDLGAALGFFVAANGLMTLSSASFLVSDKSWLLLALLYIALFVRMVVAMVRVAKRGRQSRAVRSSRAMTLVVGAAAWYWLSVIVMAWGFTHARLEVPIADMERILVVGSVAMLVGTASLVAATSFVPGKWLRFDIVVIVPAALSVVAVVGAGMAMRLESCDGGEAHPLSTCVSVGGRADHWNGRVPRHNHGDEDVRSGMPRSNRETTRLRPRFEAAPISCGTLKWRTMRTRVGGVPSLKQRHESPVGVFTHERLYGIEETVAAPRRTNLGSSSSVG